MNIGQGKAFIKHAITFVALKADELSLNNTVFLLNKMRVSGSIFVKEIAIILENSLIPQVD